MCDTQLHLVALRPLLFPLTPYILNPQISGNMTCWKGLRSRGLFDERAEDQGSNHQRQELLRPPPFSVNWSTQQKSSFLWRSKWSFFEGAFHVQWAAPPCVRVDVALFTVSLFFPLEGIAAEQNILSGVISVTDTKAAFSLSHFCWILRLSEKKPILEIHPSPREVWWLA